ncbi:MAG: hypothetical protein EKK62_17340 [Acidimicrobiia bacterium]|nr:MAG: hypothetical protein EKK62_17340 [Acidimicrobiia bacterium]
MLTEAHRLAQARLSAQTVTELVQVWPLLDPADTFATTDRWLVAVRALLTRQHDASAALARTYLLAFRAVEAPDADPFDPIVIGPLDPRRLGISMVAEGPARITKATQAGVALEQAARAAQATTAATGSRLALNGGSDTIVATAQADPVFVGIRRVTSPGCCAFCAMLAARSADGLSADFNRPHGGCHCQPETAVSGGTQMATDQARAFLDLYRQSTQDAGPDAQNAFRRALEAQRRGG